MSEQIQTTPTPQEKPTTIVICVPGDQFSGKFLECWSALISHLWIKNFHFLVSRQYDAVVSFSRTKCLGGNVLAGPAQKPFQGQVDYDYILWIDSDIVFSPNQLDQLLKHDKDIVSGLYMMKDQLNFAAVKKWDTEFFKQNGTFQFLTPQSVSEELLTEQYRKEGLINVVYTGMGFMLVKKGVFESLEYPWFNPMEQKIGDLKDITSEDVAFCLRAKEKGYNIFVDPGVRVGHEKNYVI